MPTWFDQLHRPAHVARHPYREDGETSRLSAALFLLFSCAPVFLFS